MDKAKKLSLSLSENQRTRAQQVADRRHRGNFSAYIQSLLDKDDTPASDGAISPTILTDLCKVYAGGLAGQFSRDLAAYSERNKADQPALLHRLLQIFAQAIEDQHPVAPHKLAIVDGDLHDKLISMHTADKPPTAPP